MNNCITRKIDSIFTPKEYYVFSDASKKKLLITSLVGGILLTLAACLFIAFHPQIGALSMGQMYAIVIPSSVGASMLGMPYLILLGYPQKFNDATFQRIDRIVDQSTQTLPEILE